MRSGADGVMSAIRATVGLILPAEGQVRQPRARGRYRGETRHPRPLDAESPAEELPGAPCRRRAAGHFPCFLHLFFKHLLRNEILCGPRDRRPDWTVSDISGWLWDSTLKIRMEPLLADSSLP